METIGDSGSATKVVSSGRTTSAAVTTVPSSRPSRETSISSGMFRTSASTSRTSVSAMNIRPGAGSPTKVNGTSRSEERREGIAKMDQERTEKQNTNEQKI